MKSKTGVVSAGHKVTAQAAIDMLEQGGNAYDAILAAYMAACVAEPALTSLGGGGYMLAHTHEGKSTLYDFFVQTPKLNKIEKEPHFFPVTVDFGSTTQDFHVGMGSIAVPGGVRGVFAIHKDLGSLPLDRIIQPAVRAARDGIVVSNFQAYVISLLEPIFKATPESFEIYKSLKNDDKLLSEGEILQNPDYAEFLETLAVKGDTYFYEGAIADNIVKASKEKGGYLSHDDLKEYSVEKRQPLTIDYKGAEFITNPPPSSGGILIAFALKLLEKLDVKNMDRDSALYLKTLADVMAITNKARRENVDGKLHDENIADVLLDEELLQKYRTSVAGITNKLGSTTHISVIDGEGNAASMTTSNGEGSGYVVPGTGVMLNNMLGEEDLHPHGFHQWNENERISSMMAPSILKQKDGSVISLGSGGSNRIRTAILQTLLNIIDFDMGVDEAVSHSRIHFERDELNVEPGFSDEVVGKLTDIFPNTKMHLNKGVFFGGVHVVSRKSDGSVFGAGDVRRGGVTRSTYY